MGLCLPLHSPAWIEFVSYKVHGLAKQLEDFVLSFFEGAEMAVGLIGLRTDSESTLKSWNYESLKLTEIQNQDASVDSSGETCTEIPRKNVAQEQIPPSNHLDFASVGPKSEFDAAAVKLQKVYKSYRTRRNLADCAVVAEELWWKALDFASLEHSSISFFNDDKRETAMSRWARARTRAAKVGKGLSKSSKAQKLALRHWLEAIDPRHRYGHNLHLYYNVWFESESTQPFFYWLDIGDGKEVNLEKCPRSKLQQQCIKYLGPNEREVYEVIIEKGKLLYKLSKLLVNIEDGSKWIFVLSTSRALYVGKKLKGKFQHSSFLAGGATIAAGRLVVKDGMLKAIWPYSGHYLPTEENFKEFIKFLAEKNVDLTDVKRSSLDDGDDDDDDAGSSLKKAPTERTVDGIKVIECKEDLSVTDGTELSGDEEDRALVSVQSKSNQEASNCLSLYRLCKWTTGAGPRIGCVRDYPTDLQFKALEHVNLSPRAKPPPTEVTPIPSPRPSPRGRLSPSLAYNLCIPKPCISTVLPKLESR